ncbi:MAG: zinc metallopeptidase [Clostridia bacterium]|nr:zinc metallopeptidase [Clostridia bacterium]
MLFGLFTFDWTILIVIPGLIISLWAQFKVQSTYKKYSTFYTKKRMTGADAARRILDSEGLYHIKVEHIRGNLTDHYDPRADVIRLSDSVYASTSAAALGVAAHEAGHALQHAKGYVPMKIRSAVIPMTRFGSMLSIPLFFIGLLMASEYLMLFGILLYSAVAFFQLVTLPVEFNASRRALAILRSSSMLDNEELGAARKVLTAAALTYVAALLTSLLTLLRLLVLANNRRR